MTVNYVLRCVIPVVLSNNKNKVETCPQQASVPADLKLLRDLGTNFPPIIVINSQPPIQEHCVIGWSGLQQEITVLLYIAPSAYDRDS